MMTTPVDISSVLLLANRGDLRSCPSSRDRARGRALTGGRRREHTSSRKCRKLSSMTATTSGLARLSTVRALRLTAAHRCHACCAAPGLASSPPLSPLMCASHLCRRCAINNDQ